jgi:predicted nucleic acid-binding protein
MHLLDTNVVSELRKVSSGRADSNVAAWAEAVPSGQLFISVVTLHELEHGVLLAERSDARSGAILRRWLDESIARAFDGRILPVDEAVARLAATFHVLDPAPFRDALIGATAMAHGLVMVTRNEQDFERFSGIRLLNPWR